MQGKKYFKSSNMVKKKINAQNLHNGMSIILIDVIYNTDYCCVAIIVKFIDYFNGYSVSENLFSYFLLDKILCYTFFPL